MKQFESNDKSVLIIGLTFLLLFPLFFGTIVLLLGFFKHAVFYSLLVIYGLDIVLIGWLLLNSWKSCLLIGDVSLEFESKLISREFNPVDIQDIMLYATQRGREFLRIRTKRKTYYLDEKYQPWNTLLIEMEQFVKTNNITSNLAD